MSRTSRFRWRMWLGSISGSFAVVGLWSLSWLSGSELQTPSTGVVRLVEVDSAEAVDFLEPRVLGQEREQSGRPWGAEQVVGPPNVAQPGDNGAAWASLSTDDQQEWLLCTYDAPVQLRAVMVYETYNPGALIKISVFNAAGDEVVAWEGEDPTPRDKLRGVAVIPVKVDFPVQQIRVTLDSPAVKGWNEVDAVGAEDLDGKTHWASRVEASTTYGDQTVVRPANSKRAYGAEQVTGEPDTPGPGDQSSAWAPAAPDGQPEWLVCEYKTPQSPVEIVVYENNAPGAITKIGVFQTDGTEVTIWEGRDPTPRDQQWGTSVFPVKVDFPFQKLKLYINAEEVPGHNEIDAVGLRAVNGDIEWASGAQASSTFGDPISVRTPAASPRMMRPRMNVSQNLQEMQAELQALRQQVEDLQKVRDELKELKQILKDKEQ